MDNPEKPQPETVVEETVIVEHIDSNTNSLLWISSLSGFLSWATLVVALGIVGFNIYGTVLSQQLGFNIGTLYTVLNWLILIFAGLFIFIVLQTIARGLPVLMDISDSITDLLEDKE